MLSACKKMDYIRLKAPEIPAFSANVSFVYSHMTGIMMSKGSRALDQAEDANAALPSPASQLWAIAQSFVPLLPPDTLLSTARS
jgi:hypothetical protein